LLLVASLDELARDQLTAGGAGSLERRLILIMAQSSSRHQMSPAEPHE